MFQNCIIPCIFEQQHRSPILPNSIMIVNTRADIDTRHTTINKSAITRFVLNMPADLKCALLVFDCSSDKLQLSK